MVKFQDLTGQKFGKLTVIELHHKEQKFTKDNKKDGFNYFWLCQCECGNKTIVGKCHLKSGHTKSCGCIRTETVVKMNKKHGLTNTRLYNIWSSMKQRCYNINNKRYKTYGARGIAVCEEWKNDFQVFYDWAIKNGYDETVFRGECTIDRINVNGNYEPNNCRFISMQEQVNNKTTNHYITYNNKTQSVAEWCRELNLKYSTILCRFNHGWTPEQAFKTQIRGKHNG